MADSNNSGIGGRILENETVISLRYNLRDWSTKLNRFNPPIPYHHTAHYMDNTPTRTYGVCHTNGFTHRDVTCKFQNYIN